LSEKSKRKNDDGALTSHTCVKNATSTIQFAAGEQKAHVKQQVKVKSIMGRDQSKHTACSSKSPGEG
jgi:hypothetical protein